MKAIVTKGTGDRPEYVYEDLEPTTTILDLKKLLEERQGILHTGQNMFFHFIEVNDDMLLHHYAHGQDTLRLTLILQQRGKWVPETFFVKSHNGEPTSFVVIQTQSLKVKAGIFKITQVVTKDEKKLYEVYTYLIDSDSFVNFFKKEGKIMHTTNICCPPKTVVSINNEEIKPIKKEKLTLPAETDSLDEKLSFNYNLLTTVTGVTFPPKLPATNENPGATIASVDPGWLILRDVELSPKTLSDTLHSTKNQRTRPKLSIKMTPKKPSEYREVKRSMCNSSKRVDCMGAGSTVRTPQCWEVHTRGRLKGIPQQQMTFSISTPNKQRKSPRLEEKKWAQSGSDNLTKAETVKRISDGKKSTERRRMKKIKPMDD